MTTTVIYLWGIADGIKNAIGGLCGAFLALAIITGAMAFFNESEGNAEKCSLYMLKFKKLLAAGLVLLAGCVLIPSSKTMAAMVVIPAIAQSDAIKRDLPEIYSAAVNKLKEELEIKEAEQPK